MFDYLLAAKALSSIGAVYKVILELWGRNKISGEEVSQERNLAERILREIELTERVKIESLAQDKRAFYIAELSRIAEVLMKLESADSEEQGRTELSRLRSQTDGRYFNPPSRIPLIGRRLDGRDFLSLENQLEPGEVLFGLYRNQVLALVATHLQSKERMEEMERLWAPSEGYYAVPLEAAREGLDQPIS